jgi:hypothetical protein
MSAYSRIITTCWQRLSGSFYMWENAFKNLNVLRAVNITWMYIEYPYLKFIEREMQFDQDCQIRTLKAKTCFFQTSGSYVNVSTSYVIFRLRDPTKEKKLRLYNINSILLFTFSIFFEFPSISVFEIKYIYKIVHKNN